MQSTIDLLCVNSLLINATEAVPVATKLLINLAFAITLHEPFDVGNRLEAFAVLEDLRERPDDVVLA